MRIRAKDSWLKLSVLVIVLGIISFLIPFGSLIADEKVDPCLDLQGSTGNIYLNDGTHNMLHYPWIFLTMNVILEN